MKESRWLPRNIIRVAQAAHQMDCIVLGDAVVFHHADTPGEVVGWGGSVLIVEWPDGTEQYVDKDHRPRLMRA